MAVGFQRRERKNYYIQFNGIKVGFRSPGALYDSIRNQLGVKLVNERRDQDVVYGKASELLPRLRLKLSGGGVNNTGIGNQAQSDGNSSVLVFCDPAKIESAIRSLGGRTTRGKRISGVKIPKRRQYV